MYKLKNKKYDTRPSLARVSGLSPEGIEITEECEYSRTERYIVLKKKYKKGCDITIEWVQ